MKLREKTIFTIVVTFLGLLAVLYGIENVVVMDGFNKIERDDMQSDVERLTSEYNEILSNLNEKCLDWAIWDDTYNFVNNLNGDFISNNLYDEMIAKTLKINLIMFINSSGKIVFAKAFDPDSQAPAVVPGSIKKHVTLGSKLFERIKNGNGVTGVIDLPEGPIIISANPILTSLGKGPARGFILYGLYINNDLVKKVEAKTRLAITLTPYSSPDLSQDLRKARIEFESGKSNVIIPLNKEFIAGYTVIKDIYDNPVILTEVINKRDIYGQGRKSISFILLALVLTGIVFGIMNLSLFRRTIVNRLILLNDQVKKIGVGGGILKCEVEDGKDEISSLVDEINMMLERQRRSQENLAASEEKFRTLVENLNVGVFRLMFRYNRTFLQVNQSFADIFGCKNPEKCRKLPMIDLFLSRKEAETYFESLKADIRVSRYETRMKKRDGTIFWVSCNARAKCNENGEIEYIDGVIEDISEKKKFEKMLTDKNRELNDFTYVVSHDLKNPVTILQGFLAVIKQDPSLFDEYYDRVIKQAVSIKNLIDNLLKLSRAGRIIGEKSVFEVEELVKQVYVITKPQNINAEMILKSSGSMVNGDQASLQQVLTNLIDNSVHYIDPQKEKLVMEFECRQRENEILIIISDNGKGIKSEHLEKIFSPGFTLKSNVGTGFGLSIARKIIEAHKGKIWAESLGENQGAIFYLKLPAAKIEEIQKPPVVVEA